MNNNNDFIKTRSNNSEEQYNFSSYLLLTAYVCIIYFTPLFIICRESKQKKIVKENKRKEECK